MTQPDNISNEHTITAQNVEVSEGLRDTHRGVKLGVDNEPFWRIWLTPQGSILVGDGMSPPTPLSGGAGYTVLTQAEYDALTPPEAEMLYITSDTLLIYLGEDQVGGSALTWPLDNTGATAATDALTLDVAGDVNERFILDHDGRMSWGPGNTLAEHAVSLGRSDSGNTLELRGNATSTAFRALWGNYSGTYAHAEFIASSAQAYIGLESWNDPDFVNAYLGTNQTSNLAYVGLNDVYIWSEGTKLYTTAQFDAAALGVTGITGSTTDIRVVGGTATGAPSTGAHLVGDIAVAVDGHIFICTSAGTPGTWVEVGAGSGVSDVFVEDPEDPGTYVESQLYVGDTDPAIGGEVPYIWLDPSTLGGAILTDTISDGDDAHAPDANAVFDALALKVDKSTLDANSLLGATADNTPIAFPVAASRIVGRKASGDIDDMTTAELAALFGTPTGSKFLADDGTLKTPAGGGGGGVVDYAESIRTSSNITLNSTSWANVDTGLDLTLAAQAGDLIQYTPSFYCSSVGATGGFDVATIVSGSPVNYFGSAGVGNTAYGVMAWIVPSAATGVGGSAFYIVQSGDISGGNVVLRLRYRWASSSATLNAAAILPCKVSAVNLGTPSV